MQISSNRCTHTTNNACKPMLMLHYNVQHHFPIAHMPSHILVDLGRGWFPLANVIFPKITVLDLLFLPLAYVNGTQPTDTRHGLLVHTLNNGAFNCLMTLATCSITTLDVWILCLFLPIVGRHHLIDACLNKCHRVDSQKTLLMCSCLDGSFNPFDWCHLTDVCKTQPM